MGRIRPILMYGSDKLTQKAKEVEQPFAMQPLIDDLIATCENTPTGVGLAATQIGVMSRVFIGKDNKAFINPVLVKTKGVERPFNEGCLSIPGIHARVYRPKKALFKWIDVDGNEHEQWFFDFEARIMMHELDHLDGICFPDRMRESDRKKIEKDLATFESGTFPPEDWDKYPIDWD